MPGFAPHTIRVLHDADRQIRAFTHGDHHAMYDHLRSTMGKLAQVDAFYIGLYLPDRSIAYPYTYDEGVLDSPGVDTYGPFGLGANLRAGGDPYLHSSDGGRLLNIGHQFGDTTRRSLDAMAVPLVTPGAGGTPEVIGLASAQTYRPDVYGQEELDAFQWLCRGVVAVLRRDREDEDNRRELTGEVVAAAPSTADVVLAVGAELERIVEAVGRVRRNPGSERELAALEQLCGEVRDRTFDVLVRPGADALGPLSRLTTREREIADLIGERKSNKEIAQRLGISIFTTKTHVFNVMRKFGVSQRSEIALKLHPLR